MEEKEFSALVDRLEVYARKSPGAYKLRVALLAALGYVFLMAVVVAIGVLAFAVIYFGSLNWLVIKVLAIPLGIAAIVLRSLWVEFPEPDGHQLQYDDAPRLFDLAKSTREATTGPKLHKLLLTDEFNASIVQRPRLGMFGWHENYLIVGLPLLRGLSPDEVRAVIAHEFGHLSGKHGAFSSWIYRVRLTWEQVLLKMRQEQRFGSGIFESFFKWYAPYFSAYSYVLARSREYEADRMSVQLCGKESAAGALIKIDLRNKSLNNEFWPAFLNRATKEAEPPKEPFNEMLAALRQPLSLIKAQTWFSQSLTNKHNYDDTHPALGDRLEAMGYADIRNTEYLEPFLKADDQVGDDYFLQSIASDFLASKNRLWREDVVQFWRERHKFALEAGKTLATLEEKAKTEDLSLEDRWERARLMIGTQGSAVGVVPLLREIIAVQPDHAAANYNLGEALLEQGDEAGVRHIEVAMEKDVHATPSGCELIYNFLSARKRREEAERYRRCIPEYYREIELAREERVTITAKDEFKHHGVDPEVVRKLHDQLRNHPDVAMAHLVQKVVQHFPQEPAYVLGITIERIYGNDIDNLDHRLIDKLAEEIVLPHFAYIVALERTYKPLRKVFEGIEGAEIYRAERYKANKP
jgi:Zn-dependent protease with chaperone function